jgi:hypothetical protein
MEDIPFTISNAFFIGSSISTGFPALLRNTKLFVLALALAAGAVDSAGI